MDEYLTFARSLAINAGKIMDHYFLGDTQTIKKADNSLVTIADTEINQMVIDEVLRRYPDHAVLAEEQSTANSSTHVWVCDPIDGTFYYAHGIALATFMISLVIDGVPTVAIIYEPVTGRMYTAIKGKGAYCNEQKIQVTDQSMGKGIRIDVSDSLHHEIKDLRPIGNTLHQQGVKIECLRATGFVGTMVANGVIAAALFPGKYPHDIAAVKLIVEEAGGRVSDLNGDEQRYDQFTNGAIISNGIVHQELVNLIAKNA